MAEAIAKKAKELPRQAVTNAAETRPAMEITADLLARYKACAA
ncbi:hypothetical protein AB0N77_22145 [Streptomyces misionensis]